ncbi:hypothetical protein [Peterkaempfera bronchialis]|nr:hypothetical protein [Peterkaempfera bronchialis]
MDKLLAALHRQEFKTRQTKTGTWIITRDSNTVVCGPPVTPGDVVDLIKQLREAGLVFPEED